MAREQARLSLERVADAERAARERGESDDARVRDARLEADHASARAEDVERASAVRLQASREFHGRFDSLQLDVESKGGGDRFFKNSSGRGPRTRRGNGGSRGCGRPTPPRGARFGSRRTGGRAIRGRGSLQRRRGARKAREGELGGGAVRGRPGRFAAPRRSPRGLVRREALEARICSRKRSAPPPPSAPKTEAEQSLAAPARRGRRPRKPRRSGPMPSEPSPRRDRLEAELPARLIASRDRRRTRVPADLAQAAAASALAESLGHGEPESLKRRGRSPSAAARMGSRGSRGRSQRGPRPRSPGASAPSLVLRAEARRARTRSGARRAEGRGGAEDPRDRSAR